MHIILLLVVIGVLLYLLFQKDKQLDKKQSDIEEGAEQDYLPDANQNGLYERPLAWISKGKLFLRKASGEVVQIHSEYIL